MFRPKRGNFWKARVEYFKELRDLIAFYQKWMSPVAFLLLEINEHSDYNFFNPMQYSLRNFLDKKFRRE
jgi:hypothetical protein